MKSYAYTRIFLAAAIAVALLLSPGIGRRAGAFEDVPAKILERDLADYVGQDVQFTDQVAIEWTAQDEAGFVRFDTYRFRCHISKALEDELALVRRALDARVPVRLLTFFGEVQDMDGEFIIDVARVQLVSYPKRGRRRILWKDPR